MKKRLITSALPYVNNIPHLGNLIQVLSADVMARFSRLRGYETLYICGSDEYGTATETKAREEGISPRELCDKNDAIHRDIYSWFNIHFDHYGRTTTSFQTDIVQDIFLKVYNAGYITQRTIKQLYSEKSEMFLADRYVKGECLHCHYDDARGDQCENCGKLLDPEQLINPLSILDNSTPILKETTHLYLNLPKILPRLQEWLTEASKEGRWARNAVNMTHAWIRDGLRERAITRDLKWGIPVPLDGFDDKVFYVWFDAPIGYISICAEHLAKIGGDWQNWWQSPAEVELFQFIGKDNIPFHTVIFPSTLLASGQRWTMPHQISSSEYMNYEGGKFSKSKGIGIFGNDIQETGIPADVWRFYIFYNRPETADHTFTWKDFQDTTNKELIGNLANLVNRSLRFSQPFFDETICPPDSHDPRSVEFWREVRKREAEISDCLEWAQLREAFRKICALSSYGNKVFQESEPWKLKEHNPDKVRSILADLLFLLRDLAILVKPFMPDTGERIAAFLSVKIRDWSQLASFEDSLKIEKPKILFQQLDDKLIASMRERFAGSQAERSEQQSTLALPPTSGKVGKKLSKSKKIGEQDKGLTVGERFVKRVELRVAKIIAIERHPDAETLYVATLNDGGEDDRRIVSGLVSHYREEELLHRNIVLVANLKSAKFRGIRSEGMLLAASNEQAGDEEVDVLFADYAEPGEQVVLAGKEAAGSRVRIDIDTFFDIPLRAEQGRIMAGDEVLEVGGQPLRSTKVPEGPVG